MEASDVRGPITDDQISLLAVKDAVNGPHGLLGGDVPLEDGNSVDGRHLLQVHGDYLDLARGGRLLTSLLRLVQLPREDLRPASGSST